MASWGCNKSLTLRPHLQTPYLLILMYEFPLDISSPSLGPQASQIQHIQPWTHDMCTNLLFLQHFLITMTTSPPTQAHSQNPWDEWPPSLLHSLIQSPAKASCSASHQSPSTLPLVIIGQSSHSTGQTPALAPGRLAWIQDPSWQRAQSLTSLRSPQCCDLQCPCLCTQSHDQPGTSPPFLYPLDYNPFQIYFSPCIASLVFWAHDPGSNQKASIQNQL